MVFKQMTAAARQIADLLRHDSRKIIIVICCHHSFTSPGKRPALNPIEKAQILRLGEAHGTPESWELVAKPRNNEIADDRPSAERWILQPPHLTHLGQLVVYLKTIFRSCSALLFKLWPMDQLHGHHLGTC